jgi:leucyl aminopeptidase
MKNNGTTFAFKPAKGAGLAGEVVVIPLPAQPQPPMELMTRIDRLTDGAASSLLRLKALQPDAGQICHAVHSGTCPRVVLVSLGERKKAGLVEVQRAAAAAARWLVGARVKAATLWLDGLNLLDMDNAAGEWAFATILAGFRFEQYKGSSNELPAKIQIHLQAGEKTHINHARAQIDEAVALGEAANYTRRLAHEPANELTPAAVAKEARALAQSPKLKCTVFTTQKLKQMKMNGLLAVGQGSAVPPCLVQLEYRGAPKAKTNIVLVGKTITFDTGGYSIKPSAGLENLKFDMTGGATVLGVLKAAAALKLQCNLVVLLAVAENSVSDKAYRPGDILKMMSGKTVEVTNTDAEGRLVLADALWYAQQQLKPTALIDVATLTGGVGIALGTAAAGIMATDDALAADLGEAGRRVHERLWRLPLWDDYDELLQSTEADIKNSSSKREAHAIQGGAFLKAFIQDKTAWAHLDIAAVAKMEDPRLPTAKSATGFGVRLLIEFLKQRGA